MINCLKCYQAHIEGDIIYCPFFNNNPCYRGEHYIDYKSIAMKKKNEPDVLKIFVPPSKSICYKHTKRILKELANNKNFVDLTNELGIRRETMSMYVNKILDINFINYSMLRSRKWVLVWQ